MFLIILIHVFQYRSRPPSREISMAPHRMSLSSVRNPVWRRASSLQIVDLPVPLAPVTTISGRRRNGIEAPQESHTATARPASGASATSRSTAYIPHAGQTLNTMNLHSSRAFATASSIVSSYKLRMHDGVTHNRQARCNPAAHRGRTTGSTKNGEGKMASTVDPGPPLRVLFAPAFTDRHS